MHAGLSCAVVCVCSEVDVSGCDLITFISGKISQCNQLLHLLPCASDVALCKVQRTEFPLTPVLTCQEKPILEVTIFILALQVAPEFLNAFYQQICSA